MFLHASNCCFYWVRIVLMAHLMFEWRFTSLCWWPEELHERQSCHHECIDSYCCFNLGIVSPFSQAKPHIDQIFIYFKCPDLHFLSCKLNIFGPSQEASVDHLLPCEIIIIIIIIGSYVHLVVCLGTQQVRNGSTPSPPPTTEEPWASCWSMTSPTPRASKTSANGFATLMR